MPVTAAQLVAEVSTTGVEAAQAQLEGIGTTIDEVATSLSEAWSMPEESINQLISVLIDLSNQLYDLTDVLDEVATSIEDGFAGMETSVSELSDSISSDFSQMSSSAQDSADSISASMDNTSTSLLSMAQGAFTSYLAIQGFAQGAAQLGNALIGPDAQMEQMQVAFTTLMHSSSAARDELQLLSNFAAKTPFQMMDLDTGAAKLLAFGENAKELIPDLTAIGDALSALGEATPARLGMIVDIFGKIDTTGKLTGGIMMQLSRDGINAWQALADATGKPIPVLQEMVKKGLIPASEATGWLREGLEKMYGGGMAQQAQTFNGLMSTFKDNIEAAWRSFSSPLFDKAKDALVQLGNVVASPQFQDFAKNAGQQLVTLFANLSPLVQGLAPDLGDVGDILKSLDGIVLTVVADAGAFIDGLFQAANKSGALQDVLKSVRDILPDVSAFLKKVGDDINTNLLPPLEHLVTNVGTAIANFATWLDKSGAAKTALSDLGNVIDTTTHLLGPLVDIVAKLVGWLGGGGAGTTTLVAVLGTLAVAFVALKIADTISQFTQMFSKLQEGDGIIANLADGFKNKLSSSVDDFLSKQAPNLKKSLDDIKQKSDDAGKSVSKMGDESETAGEKVSTMGTKTEASAGEVTTLGDDAQTTSAEVTTLGNDAETTSGEVTTLGTNSEVASGEVVSLGTDADASAAEVTVLGTDAELAGTEIAAMGAESAATGAEVTALGTESASAEAGIGGLLGKMGGAFGIIGAGGGTHAPVPGSGGRPIYGFAAGGTNIPAGRYLVGERGEEMMDVPGGSTIYNHSQTMNMLNGGSGSNQPIHVHIHIGDQEIGYLVEPFMNQVMRTSRRVAGSRGL